MTDDLLDLKLLKTAEVAEMFAVPVTTIWRWSRPGGILAYAAVHIGGRVRFRADLLQVFIERGGTRDEVAV